MEIFGEESADVPNVAPLQTGKLSDKTRKFDLICTGKCEVGDEIIPLKIEGHDIPDLFTLDDDGNVVIAPPKPMTTITMPKGHKSFVKITLTNIAGETSVVPNWVYLGIRQKGEITDTVSTKSAVKELNIAMFSEDVVELVPIVSGTSGSYTEVKPGTKISEITNFPQKTGDIKFGAVYRSEVTSAVQINIATNLDIYTAGNLGVGPINGQDGDVLLSHCGSSICYSSDGIKWINMNAKIDESGKRFSAPKYGNGVWCAVSDAGIRRSTNGALTWEQANEGDPGRTLLSHCLAFGNDVFLTIDYNTGDVYTSKKGAVWTKIGEAVKYCRNLVYGAGKWICDDASSHLYQSADGAGKWQPIGEADLAFKSGSLAGLCYANGYFYACKYTSQSISTIFRSPDGVKWTKEVALPVSYMGYMTIDYYKGRLYSYSGKHGVIKLM